MRSASGPIMPAQKRGALVREEAAPASSPAHGKKKRSLASVTAAALLFLSAALAQASDTAVAGTALSFSPPAWKYGMAEKGQTIRTTVTVGNLGDTPLGIRFVPTCACLGVEPAERKLEPGASAVFAISFDTSDDEGKTDKSFLVTTDPASPNPIYYLVSGVVRASNLAGGGSWMRRSPGTTGAGGTRATFTLIYFYTQGCRACEEFLSRELPALEKELGVWIEMIRKDVLDPDSYRDLVDAAAARGQSLRAMPALVAGEDLLQGDPEIRARLPGILRSAALGTSKGAAGNKESGMPVPGAGGKSLAEKLGVLSVAIAGLVDGVNPCAFTTLIFLLASLALAGRGRREILVIGSLFSFSVFATYTTIGLGLFSALRAANGVKIIGVILRWGLAAALVGLAALSLYDYYLVRRGRAGEIVLQLPTFLKTKIHDAIRKQTRSRLRMLALAGSSLILGFLVSIFEFACSGQVYFPTLAFLARSGSRGGGGGAGGSIWLLIVYNLFFILPLIVVFAASYLGTGSQKIAELFKAKMGMVKLALALVFLLLAALTILV